MDFPLYFQKVMLLWQGSIVEIDYGFFRVFGPYFIGKSLGTFKILIFGLLSCSPWAKGGGQLWPGCLEKMGSEHTPLLKDCVHYPFPPSKEGRVVPLLWPRGYRVPQNSNF